MIMFVVPVSVRPNRWLIEKVAPRKPTLFRGIYQWKLPATRVAVMLNFLASYIAPPCFS